MVCKTATLNATGTIGVKVSDFQRQLIELFSPGVRTYRGIFGRRARKEQATNANIYSYWLAYMRQLHSELREIADSVPRKK